MATIAMTLADWLRAQTEIYIDYSDAFLYAKMLTRGVDDDSVLFSDVEKRVRDLILADIYWSVASSSQKSGTSGETDGGWTHYAAIKNVVDRGGLKALAKSLYDLWGETPPAEACIVLKDLY